MKNLPILAFLLLLLSCTDDPLPETKTADTIPVMTTKSETILGNGSFTSFQHNLSGQAIFFKDTTNHTVVRLHKFTMTQGPDVHVYFSKSNNYSKANVIEITTLTEQYSNATLDINFNSSQHNEQYKFVLVYCVQFNALFGYAELK